MKRRLKRKSNKRKLFVIIGGVMILIIIVLLNLNYLKEIQIDYKDKINALTREYKLKEVRVYQAKEHILAGSALTWDNVVEKTVVTDQNSDYYMTSENIGNITLVDVKEGSWIYKDILRKDSIPDNIREVEYSTFLIGSNIKPKDYFDLHIQYPNGEDYIVLSKSLIKGIDEINQYLYLWLAPEELFNLSGAIVDCYLNEGARLYSVKYIEPTIQKASILTFTPNEDIINLMKRDPNSINTAIRGLEEQARRELEQRLYLFYSEHETYKANNQDSIYYPDRNVNTTTGHNASESNQENSKISNKSGPNENIMTKSELNDGVIEGEINKGEAIEEEVYYVD